MSIPTTPAPAFTDDDVVVFTPPPPAKTGGLLDAVTAVRFKLGWIPVMTAPKGVGRNYFVTATKDDERTVGIYMWHKVRHLIDGFPTADEFLNDVTVDDYDKSEGLFSRALGIRAERGLVPIGTADPTLGDVQPKQYSVTVTGTDARTVSHRVLSASAPRSPTAHNGRTKATPRKSPEPAPRKTREIVIVKNTDPTAHAGRTKAMPVRRFKRVLVTKAQLEAAIAERRALETEAEAETAPSPKRRKVSEDDTSDEEWDLPSDDGNDEPVVVPRPILFQDMAPPAVSPFIKSRTPSGAPPAVTRSQSAIEAEPEGTDTPNGRSTTKPLTYKEMRAAGVPATQARELARLAWQP